MDEKVMQAALAGLLHDIGKLLQRATIKTTQNDFDNSESGPRGYHALLLSDFIGKYVPTRLQKGLSDVMFHKKADLDDPFVRQIRLADQLAAGESRKDNEEQVSLQDARLIPILSNMSLIEPHPIGLWHRLAALETNNAEATYPTRTKSGDYPSLWKQMVSELDHWKASLGENGWENQSPDDYYLTMLAVFEKYLWCVPSTTSWQEKDTGQSNRIWPDVSLFDHSRLVSAIAACLTYDNNLPDKNSDKPIALLIRGDVSGIQKFIYRISSSESETEHVAKRLRGRSFYLQLLTEVIVDWILREIGLPPNCAIFVGGGRFDLLLPLLSKQKFINLNETLSQWLFKEFLGELGLWVGIEEARASDFSNTREISRKINESLEHSKRLKWQEMLQEPGFFEPHGNQWHVCSVCRLTPMPDSGLVCDLCRQHENIGKHLPYASYLAYYYSQRPNLPAEQVIEFDRAPFGVWIGILRDKQDLGSLVPARQIARLFSLNRTNNFIVPGIASSFRFLANAAPKAKNEIKISSSQNLHAGDVLHFEAIAELSTGAKRIGILKADVDHLGLLMSEGLYEDEENMDNKATARPTLSRVAAVSRMLDMFFSGHVNRICHEIYLNWRNTEQSQYADKTDGLFYVIYSGGDDLFIVGPWDQVLKLALKLREEFFGFTGNNTNLTLSAGYVQVKPRYPTQKFAELVDTAEKHAKGDGRNRISAFGETMVWTEEDLKDANTNSSFEWLFEEAKRWSTAIHDKEISGGLIYDLGGLFRQHRLPDGRLQPMWTPRLYYTLARRLKPEVREKYQKGIIKAITSRKILVPVSIASLSIRERKE